MLESLRPSYTQNPFYDFRILLEHGLVPLQPQYQLAIAHPSGTLTTDTFSSVNNTNG